jgi:hypothetical protein
MIKAIGKFISQEKAIIIRVTKLDINTSEMGRKHNDVYTGILLMERKVSQR